MVVHLLKWVLLPAVKTFCFVLINTWVFLFFLYYIFNISLTAIPDITVIACRIHFSLSNMVPQI